MKSIALAVVTTCVAQEATVMLQSTNHLVSHITSGIGIDLLDLDTAKILNLVKKDGVGSLEVVLEELEKLVPPTLDSGHSSDQSLITSSYDTQVACGTSRDDAEMTLTWSSFEEALSTHKGCRSVQKEADDDQASKCTAQSDWLTVKSTGCMLDVCDLSLGSDAGTTLRNLAAELTTFAGEADTHKTNCDTATETNAAKTLECSNLQVIAEQGYCTWFELQKSQWETYFSCRAGIDDAYDAHIETVKENEKSRHLQFEQYQNIVCLLQDVVTASSTIDEAELTGRMENCKAQDVDTSNYDINYPGVAVLDENPNIGALMTTEPAWVVTYFNDLAIGPADVQAVCPSAVTTITTNVPADKLQVQYGYSSSLGVERYNEKTDSTLDECKALVGTTSGQCEVVMYAALGASSCHYYCDYYPDTTWTHGDTIQGAWYLSE